MLLIQTSLQEIAHDKQLLLFPNFAISSNVKLSSTNSFTLEESKICCLVMGKDSSSCDERLMMGTFVNPFPKDKFYTLSN